MTTLLNPDIITTIAQKLCDQILAFQRSIEARAEGQRFPTPQETNQQHKLITCLLRLTKQPARPRQERTQDPEVVSALQSWGKVVDEVFSMPTSSDYIPTATQPTPTSAPQRPVVTQRDFEQYGHLLGKSSFANLTDKTTIKFNGRYVNAKWLEYNLFQFCLPAEDRRFIDDARKVIADIDHKLTQQLIHDYLSNVAAHKQAA